MTNVDADRYQDDYKGELDIPERMTNKYIRRDRLKEMLMNSMGKVFGRADQDADNRLTYEELEKHMARMNEGRKYDTK